MDSSFFLTMCAAATSFFALLVTLFFMFYKKFRFRENNKTENSTSLSHLPPPSSLPRNWIHNVFPSFHGEDVRISFLSHILKEFRSKGIVPFIDDEMKRGEFIGPELKKAIQGSRIAIVLLSKHYASSSWCLDELVEIIKCKEDLGQTVMVIFYEVDPTDVKKQAGYFGKVFRKTCKGKTKEVIGRWSQALAEVATIAGYHSSKWNNDAKMVEDIATDVSNMLFNSTLSRDFNDFVGMGAHLKKIERILGTDLNQVRMIGIWGPPGIGKTTIARCLFNQLSKSNNFPYSVFMTNVKAMYTTPVCSDDYDAKLHLQQKFLSQITNQKEGFKISHLGAAQERLHDKRVLVVFDNVDRSAQLDAMAKDIRWFGPGSWIIVTTQDKSLLSAHGIKDIYKVDFPAANEALQIFCMNAFGQKSPKDGFEKLALEVTQLAGKLPLGLTVMGSHLRRKSKQEWKMALPRLRNSLDGKIESVLKFSYDALCDEDKNLFLHIACFFVYEEIEKVKEHLAKKFVGIKEGLHVLAEKSLISIPNGVTIRMHSLLVQLGKEIVRKQSEHEPGQRQFLVDDKDICEVLTDPTAIARSVIGINSEYNRKWEQLNISERVFEGMSNLQFLKLHGRFDQTKKASLPGYLFPERLKYISPKLQLLDWLYCPMTSLPFIGNLEFLVELRMPFSKLEKLWEGIKLLQNLKWMDLSSSYNLRELPNLSTATNLQKLDLSRCSSLVELPSSIGNATNLFYLNLGGCKNLVELPSSIGNATNLQELNLSYCSRLLGLPSSIGNAINLKKLNLSECHRIENIPSSIGNLHKLSELKMDTCSKLKNLPTNINMECLKELDLGYCELLESFPEISTNIEFLQIFETSIKEIPSSITSWPRLRSLWMSERDQHLIPPGLKVIPFLVGTGPEWSRDPYEISRYEFEKEQQAEFEKEQQANRLTAE